MRFVASSFPSLRFLAMIREVLDRSIIFYRHRDEDFISFLDAEPQHHWIPRHLGTVQ